MSNLSELLPSGGGQNVVSMTATGNISGGVPVALNSDGTVSVITTTTTTEGLSSQSTHETTNSTEVCVAAHDPTNNKLVIIYRNGSSSDSGTAVVGTVSGDSITFGTPVVFESGNTSEHDICFDPNSGNVLITYSDNNDGQNGKSIVGTVSGNSISFGSIVEFHTGGTRSTAVSYNTYHGKHLVVYRDTGESNKIKARVGTVSGTSVSWGTEADVTSAEAYKPRLDYDSSTYAHLVVYEDQDNSQYGTARVATISGTSVSFGSAVVFNSGTTQEQTTSYDSGNNKFVVFFKDQSDSNNGKAVVGTISGTDVSFGSEVAYDTAGEASDNFSDYDATSGKVVVVYSMWDGSASSVRYAVGTVSGTSISFETPVAWTDNAGGNPGSFELTYDSTAGKMIFVYRSTDSSNRGGAKILTNASSSTNITNTIGIAAKAIANSAAGDINVFGGISTSSSFLSSVTTPSFGSEAVYNTGNSRYPAIVYDTTNNKIVIAWADYSDSNKGKAVVGTVSGTSITYGSVVEFNSGSTDYVTAAFDASAGKVVIGYRDVGNSNYGTAIVGTVSGTSISFGTEVVFESAESMYVEASYDANAQKTLFVYSDKGNSDVLTAQVGTVSGTSISFGGASALTSDGVTNITVAYDSTAYKHVVFFKNSDNGDRGDAGVVTIVGTSMSVGSFTTGVATNANRTASAYDANANKTVIFYSDADSSNHGMAIVGTVSGTTITFGTAVHFCDSLGAAAFHGTPAFFDSTTNTILIMYNDAGDSNKGKAKIGTVSGNTITFGDAVVFNSGSTSGGEIAIAKDTDNNKLVIAFKDNGNSNYGTGIVGTLTSASPSLTIGSNYYAQSDGTISTTSTSPAVLLGQAISTTTINMRNLT